jgi:hypothetical protein
MAVSCSAAFEPVRSEPNPVSIQYILIYLYCYIWLFPVQHFLNWLGSCLTLCIRKGVEIRSIVLNTCDITIGLLTLRAI